MHKIDPSFSQKRAEALQAGKRRRLLAFSFFFGFLTIAACAISVWRYLPEAAVEATEDFELAQVEDAADPEAPAFQSDIIDLAGDPLRINRQEESEGKRNLRYFVAPRVLARYGVQGNIGYFNDKVLPSGSELMITLPSTQRDFAFYQSQKLDAGEATRVAADLVANRLKPEVEPTEDSAEPGDIPSSPSLVVDDAADLSGTDEQWKKGTIENNISSGHLIAEEARIKQWDDKFLKVDGNPELAYFLVQHDVNAVISRMASDAMNKSYGVGRLVSGTIVALRFQRSVGLSGRRRLVQLAIYAPGKYVGAVAISSDGSTFTDAADPWLDKKLTSFQDTQQEDQPTQRYRLIDGIYSAAIRNGVQSSIAGEAIMQLSRHYDLAEFATQTDTITVVFSVKPREFEGSRTNIMYVAIDRGDKTLRCFVTRRTETKDFGCYDEQKGSSVPLLSGEMYKPVDGGVLTSKFGLRKHPILGKMLPHNGVDWAAPTGTPVRAAYDGVINSASVSGSAGNMVVIDHPRSRKTRYFHLSAFAAGLKKGLQVKAGDLIGYVGTTGRSTGPHLHFELLVGLEAVDPLQIKLADSGSTESVNALVNMIIRVESGGNANAKNPLSTATGLGQFIESTWMDMMRKHRPDLVTKYTRAELLGLRTDPTLAREMVTNLARENEAYLRSRGHAITAGRLYLAHFLGNVGADQVLSASDDTNLGNILGAGVVKANPFLSGWTVAKIKSWSDGKMSKRSTKVRVEEKPKEMAKELPPEYREYKRHLDRIVQLASSTSVR